MHLKTNQNLNPCLTKTNFVTNQVCIFTTNQEFEAILIQDKLIDANVDVVMLNKKDSSYQTFGQIELYVPVLQAEKAKTILKLLNE